MQGNQQDDALVRVEIYRALAARFGGIAPVTAADAFEAARGHRISSTSLTRRRVRDALPWPRSVEIVDGPRRLVPLVALVDCLSGTLADSPRPRRGRGRPAKAAGGAL